MMRQLFPYSTLDDNLTLKISSILLQTENENGVSEAPFDLKGLDQDLRTFWLPRDGESHWDRTKVAFDVTTSRSKLEAMDGATLVSVALLAECGSTNFRRSFRLTPSSADPAFWSGALEIDPRSVRGSMSLKAVLTGTVNGVPNRWLAESDEWTVRIDETQGRFLGGALKVRWVDFEEDQKYGDLRKYKDDPFYVNLETDEPEVYLNSRVKGLRELFPRFQRPKGGPALALHETTRTSIARSVWMSLFESALASIKIEEEEEPDWPDQEWQKKVLEMILPRVFDAEKDAALVSAAQALAANDIRQLVSRSTAFIGSEIVKEGRAYRIALNKITDLPAEEELP